MAQFLPIMPGVSGFLHGGDYNPDQWLSMKKEIWPRDMELAKAAGINTLSVGIFSWSALETADGVYDFSWLDEVMDMLANNGITAVLATPSGAKPAWMAQKYPEVLRVNAHRQRELFGGRHNHCLSSPIYARKVTDINTRLAERYKDHPALKLWHLSNEYGGECHCPLCQARFREWLKARYGTIDALNQAWWNAFWSHNYSSFEQVESPSPIGESSSHGLNLAWKRFTTQQHIDFYRMEIAPLKRITPDILCTTNIMGMYEGIDYFRLGAELDVVSWDNYPAWTGDERDIEVGLKAAFCHDLMRGTGNGKPFLLMESSPSYVNWAPVNALRDNGVVLMQSLQAVAHGSDSVQYFQFRKGRGSFEKFHGAVVSHDNREDGRVYKEVCAVGDALQRIAPVQGSAPENDIAVMFDWENRWALNDARFGLSDKGYDATVLKHHGAILKLGYGADVVDETCDLSSYKVICAPMTYMLKRGYADKVRAFVKNGGVYVSTYCSGWVDEEDLCFMDGFPGPLKDVAGVWDEETDALDSTLNAHFTWRDKTYECRDYCALLHPETAQVLATYDDRFYRGMSALTVNAYGAGQYYVIAARTGADFLRDFYSTVLAEANMHPIVANLPDGVIASRRIGDNGDFIFLTNLSPNANTVYLPKSTNLLTGQKVMGDIEMPPHGVLVLNTKGGE